MVKKLIFFIYLTIFFGCFVSSQDILYTYEEPIEGLQFFDTIANTDGTMMVWMIEENKEMESCILPEFHLRLIDKIGNITYIDLNYNFPPEVLCPKIKISFRPLTYNYVLITYSKSLNNSNVDGKFGVIINYSGDVISELFLGNFSGYTERSILPDRGFIHIEEPDENGAERWKWFNSPNALTEEVVERKSGKFNVPDLPSYNLMSSLKFGLIDGGFGILYILKYDKTKMLQRLEDPNLQHWRIYVSFLRDGADTPTIPSLVYQTTKELNSIESNSCLPTYNGDGYICIMSLNNTIKKGYSVINYYQLGFLSTGAFERLDIITRPTNPKEFSLTSLFYGGFLVRNIYENASTFDGYILDNNGNFVKNWGFGPELVHFNQFRRNNTIYGITKQDNQKLNILLKPLPKLNNNDNEYQNPIIRSTNPAIGAVIDPAINEITVTYNIPVRLSSANISIFQLNKDPYNPGLLRQTFSGESKSCYVGDDNSTVHVPIFKSTFSQPNASYYVTIENNFVVSYMKDEPLIGINEKIWMFSTDPSLKKGQHSDSVTGSLRLNQEGSLRFLETENRTQFFQDMIQEFSAIIPINYQRLSTNEKWQRDPDSPNKVLLSFNINEAKDDTIEQSSLMIYDNLNALIKNKDFTALSINNYTSLIDENVPFKMTQNYLEKFFPLIIVLITCFIILTILYLLACRRNTGGKNFAIFGTAFIIEDFAVDLAFTLFVVKNVPKLIIPNIIFFVVPIIFNCLLALNIFVFEITNNPSFVTWFGRYPALSSIFTLFSAVDIQVLDTLSSGLAGLTIFSAPLTQRSKKVTILGSIINIFIEDLPQFIIQIIYYRNVITYDIIPSLALISGGLIILNKLILRSYDALVRCHRQKKVRNSYLSTTSIKSLMLINEDLNEKNEKKVEKENNDNKEEEKERDLTNNIIIESS